MFVNGNQIILANYGAINKTRILVDQKKTMNELLNCHLMQEMGVVGKINQNCTPQHNRRLA